MTTRDLEIVKKSGIYFIAEYENEDIDSAEYTGNDEELLHAENLFATEEEAEESVNSWWEENYICHDCGEVCERRYMSCEENVCDDCYERGLKAYQQDLNDKNMDYWKDRI